MNTVTWLARLTFILFLATISAIPARGGAPLLEDAGVGAYRDASTLFTSSFFTINPEMVSCGVEVQVPADLAPDGQSFMLTMLMHATEIERYDVTRQRESGKIQVVGTMRSITQFDELTMEDAEHPFVAIAVDDQSDRFDVHFATPFWGTNNPFCTPSDVEEGLCRFGGEVSLGDVVVSIPEPSSMALMLLGSFLTLGFVRHRRHLTLFHSKSNEPVGRR